MALAHAGRGARGAATQALFLTLAACLQAAAAVEEPTLPPRWRYAGSHTEAQWLWLSDPMTLVVALVGLLLFVLSQLKHRVVVGTPPWPSSTAPHTSPEVALLTPIFSNSHVSFCITTFVSASMHSLIMVVAPPRTNFCFCAYTPP